MINGQTAAVLVDIRNAIILCGENATPCGPIMTMGSVGPEYEMGVYGAPTG